MKQLFLTSFLISALLTGIQAQNKLRKEDPYFKKYEKTFSKLGKKDKALAALLGTDPEKLKTDTAFRKDYFRRASELNKERRELENSFIQQYPGSMISYDLVRKQLGKTSDVDRIEKAMAQLAPSVRQSNEATSYFEEVEKMKAVGIGKPAPAFSQTDSSGKMISLSDFKGKYVLIDFWASWCGPCRAENPHVVKAFKQYRDRNFTVLGVSLDKENGKEAWLQAIKDDKLSWTHVSDLKWWKNEVAQQYFVSAIPTNFLVDPNGIIVARNLRGERLGKVLDSLLPAAKDFGAISSLIMKQISQLGEEQPLADAKKLYDEIFQKYPEAAHQQIHYTYDLARLIMSSKLLNEDYAAAKKIMDEIKPGPLRKTTLGSAAHKLADAGNFNRARALLQPDIELAKGSGGKMKDSATYYALSMNYAYVLHKEGSFAEALPLMQEANRMRYAKSNEEKALLGFLLEKNNQPAEALEVFTSLVREGRGDDKVKASLKATWAAAGKNPKAFAAFEKSLAETLKQNKSGHIKEFAVNYPAPDFTLKNLNGNPVQLSRLKGRVVVLDFWATWCGPCVKSFPVMQAAADKYKKANVDFLFINSWESQPDENKRTELVQKFVDKNGYRFDVLLDRTIADDATKYEVIQQYKVKGIPAKFIIDKKGIVRYALTGFDGNFDASLVELSLLIDQLQAEKV